MTPKYQLVADKIRSDIRSRVYLPDEAIPTERELQGIFKVSRDTIRKAISLLVSDGLLVAEKGSGTYVKEPGLNDSSEGDKSNVATKTIGLITTYISDYIFPEIIRGVEKGLKARGYSLLLSSTDNNHSLEKMSLEQMINFGVDGLIVEPTKSNQYNPNLATYVTLREHSIPIIMLNSHYEEIRCPWLRLDDTLASYLMTKDLIENHHKNIMVMTKIDDSQGKYRLKGFIQACEEYDITLDPDSIVTFTSENSTDFYDDVIMHIQKNQVTGIVGYNDKTARILMGKLMALGYRVPQDISITGIDNSALSSMGALHLTTVDHPKERMGIDAANMIADMIEHGATPDNITYEPTPITGDTVMDCDVANTLNLQGSLIPYQGHHPAVI
jgi:GntR family transcriptional regulator of arabinose operon